ncbi:hypothetical protein [Levilactobacillus brevis]|uniref:hypothetical protein n=1 Tax=Levilactobacillus brevis TaxID=1580 RepID=UPI0035A37983
MYVKQRTALYSTKRSWVTTLSLTGAFIGIADRMTRVGDDKVTTISEYESQARSIEMTLGITAYKYGQQVQDKLEG